MFIDLSIAVIAQLLQLSWVNNKFIYTHLGLHHVPVLGTNWLILSYQQINVFKLKFHVFGGVFLC